MNDVENLRRAKAQRESLEEADKIKTELAEEKRKIAELQHPSIKLVKKFGRGVLKVLDNMTKPREGETPHKSAERIQKFNEALLGKPKTFDFKEEQK